METSARFLLAGNRSGIALARPNGKIAQLLNEKKYRVILRRLRRLPGFDEHEAILFARSLAATPDQRWEMNRNFLRSLGCSSLSARLELNSK
ncbi:MAG: hypothetical protein ACR2NX_15030 [Chthoniobacterales bacterium]